MSNKTVLILGVGSPFGADRLGWLAVAALEQQPLAAQFPQLALRFEHSDRPGSRLLSLLGQADAALIIDAMCSGAPAGTVRQFAAHELDRTTGLTSSHGFGVVEALALGAQLGQLPVQLAVIGIEMDAARDAEDTLQTAWPPLAAAVQEQLCRFV